jgi:chromosome segregation protein
MRLKSLEIKGFKSFANETVINFNEDVIGIVGPNGSGKSNVVDAIRWVLGEQKSSQLRLDKMTSVIFNGTKKRKEAQMASVALTFENTKNILPTEYNMVTVMRIIYRSGESEYRLNGVSCRLKDITSLLMDTGMGPDSYAIIALGMVDDLLSDREQARRKMFEQAAGVSKYKARKHETQQKLEATAGDLDRIEDLLFEIEENLKKLEKQAARTQKYYELKDEYKKLSIELAVINLSRHKDNYKRLEGEISKEEDNYRRMETDIRTLDATIESKRKQHTDKESSLSEQQSSMNQIVGRTRSKENEKQLLVQKMGFMETETMRASNQSVQAQAQIVKLEDDVIYYQTETNSEKNLEIELEEALSDAQKLLEKVRGDHNMLKGNLDEFVKAQQDVEREIADLEKQRAIQASQIENLTRDVERTFADIRVRREEMQSLSEQVKEREEAEEKFQFRIETLEDTENRRLSEVAKTETETETVTKKVAEQHRILDSKRNEYKLTKSMVESLEGFPESIKFLSQQKDWSKNCPLLSDLIYVKEEYRVAIENYLEPYLNYYVVPNADEAVKAIQLLGKSQKGRANFFMLDAFAKYEAPLVMLPDATLAIELVTIDPKYRGLVAFLLENVLLIEKDEQFESFRDMADKNKSNLVILTRSGTFTSRRFSLSGGSVGLFEGKKIGRRKNMELLDEEIKTLEKVENDLNSKLATLRTHLQSLKSADQRQTLQKEKDLLNKTAQERVSLKARLENIAAFVASFDAKAGESTKTIEDLTVRNTEIEKQLQIKTKFATEAKEKLSSVDGSFRDVAEQLSSASQGYNMKNIDFIKQQNKVSAFQQELSFREKQLTDLRSQLAQNQTILRKSNEESTFVKDDIARLESELLQLYQEKKDKEALLSGVEQTYYAARNEIVKMEDEQRGFFRKQQDLQLAINQKKEKFGDVKFEITSIGERLRVEFAMSVNDIINREVNPLFKRDDLEKEVNNMKRRLDTYGEINPLAVEAYNEIKERYDTISTQRNDINSAKVSLLETMKEIEETATARFLESFAQVRTHFIEVFRSLFSEEDTADLVLTKPDTPLDSDINIIAKPKGKRPQHISQLSGGEKTLTATALLFALYLLKPAPFCIFDEVDAPLDDANIEKFNKIIKKFSKDSQFIIVTHNKATMVAVDVIYGVYMPEMGVSAVSAVDFRSLGNEAMVFEAN